MEQSVQKHQGNSTRGRATQYWLGVARWSLLILLVLELFIRTIVMLLPRYDYKPGWGLVPVPNSISVQGREGYGVIHFMENGEVQTPYEGGLSVVVLGDSTVRAAQVDDTDNFVSLAESILRKRGLEIDLHNLGSSERVVADHVYYAPMILSKYQPKYVIIQVSIPSFALSLRDTHDNYFAVRDDGSLELVHRDSGGEDLALKNVIYSSGLLSFFDFRWQNTKREMTIGNPEGFNLNLSAGNANAAPMPDGDVSSDKTISYDQIQLQVEALKAAYQGVEIIFLIVPYTPSISPGSKHELSWISGADNLLALALSNVYGVRVLYIRDEFQRLYERQHILTRGSFNSEFNFGHLNRYGHRIVARSLADALESLLK